MECLAGSSNWKLKIRREAEGIVITRAVTCDRSARLPEELFGLPVTALGDHALSRGEEGEEVLITCGPTEGREWNNRKMEELWLPEQLRRVDSYGLYNCTGLQTLHLRDGVENWGSGALMNCQNIRRIFLHADGREGPLVNYLASELPMELDITVQRARDTEVRLLLPEYFEDYEENGPAHIFNFRIYGAGYGYHHCFRHRKLDMTAYDRLWEELITTGAAADESTLRIAWYRLRWPAELSEKAEKSYTDYLCRRRMDAAGQLVETGDTAGLRFLLEKASWEPEELSQLCAQARERRRSEALAVLLEKQHQRRPAGFARSFDL